MNQPSLNSSVREQKQIINTQQHTREEIKMSVDNLVQENEEFLSKFEDCKEAILQQVHSILFQFEKLKLL